MDITIPYQRGAASSIASNRRFSWLPRGYSAVSALARRRKSGPRSCSACRRFRRAWLRPDACKSMAAWTRSNVVAPGMARSSSGGDVGTGATTPARPAPDAGRLRRGIGSSGGRRWRSLLSRPRLGRRRCLRIAALPCRRRGIRRTTPFCVLMMRDSQSSRWIPSGCANRRTTSNGKPKRDGVVLGSDSVSAALPLGGASSPLCIVHRNSAVRRASSSSAPNAPFRARASGVPRTRSSAARPTTSPHPFEILRKPYLVALGGSLRDGSD